jgi:L-seryl-tRNA(Ser) seleniumtransferase
MDVYEKYHVSRVINASGKMTILGGSRVNEQIIEQCAIGAGNFFEVKDLLDKTGEYIAHLLNVESAYIVNSASGGIAQAIGAAICQDDYHKIMNLYDPSLLKREVIICKGHNVNYGTAIEVTMRLGGAKVVEAGYANECTLESIKACIHENTAALLYVKSHHCVQKGMPTPEEFIDLAHQYHLPVIVDAAAESDLIKYYQMGAECVIYSGTKALGGPTSGLVIGKKNYIDLIKMQYAGIGRIMKVGKENIIGLTYAIEEYVRKPQMTIEQQTERFKPFNDSLNQLNGISAKCIQDGAGRPIVRSEITFKTHDAKAVSRLLKTGDVHIYTRDYKANLGQIEIDIRDVNDEELMMIYQRIKEIVEE